MSKGVLSVLQRIGIILLIASALIHAPVYAESVQPPVSYGIIAGEHAADPASSVVKIYSTFRKQGGGDWGVYSHIGSGFFIAGGYIVTNAHVAACSDNLVYGIDLDGKEYKAYEVYRDTKKDLALYKTEDTAHAYLSIASAAIPSDTYTTYGTGLNEDVTVKTGTLIQQSMEVSLNNITSAKDLYSFISQAGASGAAIMNSQNEVTGVLVAHLADTKQTLAISLVELKSFLSDAAYNTLSGKEQKP